MIEVWLVVLAVIFLGAMGYQFRHRHRENKKAILDQIARTEGAEAAKAMKAHLDGEWR